MREAGGSEIPNGARHKLKEVRSRNFTVKGSGHMGNASREADVVQRRSEEMQRPLFALNKLGN